MINSYGIPGESQETRTALAQSAPYVLMKSDRPDPHYVATAGGDWVEGPPVAITCSKRQGELALLELPSPVDGLPSFLHWVESLIEAEADPIEKRRMQAYFNAAEWRSDDEFVVRVWLAAGRDLTDLPALFQHAKTI